MESMVWNEEIEMKALLSLFALSLIATGPVSYTHLSISMMTGSRNPGKTSWRSWMTRAGRTMTLSTISDSL